ncbi:Zn-ribbon domain-containing OB-fold protein [Pseudonocardia sp. ICBG1293]|uniref:Zn-ribbon domain-containing OB-fold protein n=1 Tax=Pseudonocardia sp. ICBG1293 TaxID=2844382 RepID=UPI001CCDABAD|nr:OB-fold domain-containing protein [Pseudonocardia sp. ICBG1293]
MTGFPQVERDDTSAAFYDAAAREELLMQRGPSGTVLPPEARTDPASGSAELEPVTVSGDGVLVSWAVVHRAPLPALADAVPYVSAVVELAEGPWIIVRLVGDTRSLSAGDPVRARFVRSGAPEDPGEVLPVFERVVTGVTS